MTDTIERNSCGVPVRALGKTGLKVSVIGVGGGHFCRKHVSEQESLELVRTAVDAGVTFIDTAWEYHGGESERRMGLALQGRRDKVVLMTKVCARDARGALEQLDESLRRLHTDRIDVWQFHEVNYDNDPEWIFRSGGAIEAAVHARQAGKVRFIGFTGHKSPHITLKMLEQGFDWDTVQMPISILDPHYRSFVRNVLPELQRRNIGCIGMKSLGGDGQLVKEAGLTAQDCRRFALSQPISTLVCGMESLANLHQDLEIARHFTPLTDEETKQFLSRVQEFACDGRYEWYKSTQYFDSKLHRDQHGFPPIGHVGGPTAH